MNKKDGHYAIDCWAAADPGKAEPDESWFSDDRSELAVKADLLIGSRRFALIELSEKRPGTPPDNWYRLTRFVVPEQLD
jgi:hypothetical protein